MVRGAAPVKLRTLLVLSVVIFLILVLSVRPRKKVVRYPPPFEWQPVVTGAKSCPDSFRRLYDEPVLEIGINFGYKDARPARFVGDRYERATFVSGLVAPCPKDFHACGFTRDEEDGDLFTKKIQGPDGYLRTIRVRVTSSSAGPDDDENRRDTYQRWLSRYAQREFEAGVSKKKVVLYNGHSRAGGGPDFKPPQLTREGMETDLYWYKTKQPGIKALMEALPEGDGEIQLLGLYSCVSTKHFSDAIWKKSPKLALISSRELLYYADALRNLSGTLSAVVGMWCESDFGSAISAEPAGGKTSLARFFAPKAKK